MNLGVGHSAFNVYKKQYPELAEVLKKGKEVLITEIENALVKRALGNHPVHNGQGRFVQLNVTGL